jgi:hypothetical protein
MGVPASEVVDPLATTGRGDHEVHKGHVVALAKEKNPGKHRVCIVKMLNQICVV